MSRKKTAAPAAPQPHGMKKGLTNYGDADWAIVRPPLVELDAAQRAALREALRAIDFSMTGLEEAALT